MNDHKMTDYQNVVESAATAIRENPLPAALIGMGLVWLFAGGRAGLRGAGGSASEFTRDMGQTIGGFAEASSRGLGRTVDAVSRTASDAASRIASSAREKAPASLQFDSQFFSNAHWKDVLQQQPLLIGALGLAIGAAVGSSLKTTKREAELFGETSAALQGKARGVAVDYAKRASDIVDGVATTVEREARAQGLTPDAIGRQAGEGLRKAQAVVRQGVETATEKLK